MKNQDPSTPPIGLNYASVGVSYDKMDPFKRLAQQEAATTADQVLRFGFKEIPASRGESAYLIDTPLGLIAQVEEGLGTKNLVADAMFKLTGTSYYRHIAQDTIAMIVNDMITLGALPVATAMHLAVGNSNWFDNQVITSDLLVGWKEACIKARCAWGGGETPTLKGMIVDGTALLSGSAWGIIKDRSNLLESAKLRDGDAIIILASSGIHANGLTMARRIAEMTDRGYLESLSDGRTYGESLLDPTVIYVGLLDDCQRDKVELHYAANITGHGWRKIIRAERYFDYLIHDIPKPQPVFEQIQRVGNVSEKDMYADFNMGAGFALFAPVNEVAKIINLANANGIQALHAGTIKERIDKRKRVVIEPKNIEFYGETLGVRLN